ncbi:tripartite tricarboxylate transporter substrate binding protein [Phaeovulum sp. W22_SRMD_FR3]|uniref:tripartite tricarboxylate transporter substrate binding protein n=1 Tax=Phaeovulum sp. W22_SRMD_FR3 TaxID=3240274 RepID=UPI003F9B65D1
MRNFVTLSAAALCAASLFSPVSAQDYPAQDIDLIVPFEPGGAVDITSRILAEAANGLLDGATVTVLNKAGGGGIVGQAFAASAPADGYTVLAMTSSVVTNPKMKGAPYEVTDFVPVGMYGFDPEVLVVRAESPYQTAADFLAASTPDHPLNLVVAGMGTSHHMAGLAIEQVSPARFNYVPTKGFGEQVQAVLGGHVDGALWSLGEASAQVQSGGVRILALASDQRHPSYPDVPTFPEAGIDVPVWATFRGWSVPKGTPEPVVAKLSDLMFEMYNDKAYFDKMTEAGFDPVYRDAAGFQKIIDSYTVLANAIIDENGLAQ